LIDVAGKVKKALAHPEAAAEAKQQVSVCIFRLS
jgi:hypothetical protein